MSLNAGQPSESGKPCDICGIAAATCHLCEFVCGNKMVLDLCEACMRERALQLDRPLPDMRGATCYYCGAAATSAGMNQAWEIECRGVPFHYTCSRCLVLQHDLALEALSHVSESQSADEQMLRIKNIIKQVDEEVRILARKQRN